MPPAINDNAKGPLINIAVWIVSVAAVLAAGLKVFIKVHATKSIGPDDWAITGAFLLALGQTIAISIEVNNGLGTRNGMLAASEIDLFFKAQYVEQIFYVCGINIVKFTPLYFFPVISISRRSGLAMKALTGILWIWTTVSVFVVVFQCQLPAPWRNTESACINMDAFWGIFMVIDSLSQLVIAAIPIILLRHLQMTQRWRKWFAMFCFTPNIFTIPLAVIRYLYIRQLQSSQDYLWDAFDYTLLSGIHLPIAIFIVAGSFVKPFIDSVILMPQVLGDSTLRRATQPTRALHPSIYPGNSNFSSTIESGNRKSRRISERVSMKKPVYLFQWSNASRKNSHDANALREVDVIDHQYIHLDGASRSSQGTAPEAESAAPQQTTTANGRPPLVIMKTTTATVSSELR